MKLDFQQVGEAQTETLLPLMREFYGLLEMPWNEGITRRSLAELLRDPDLGNIWLIRADSELTGYFVLTLAFSLEFGGKFGLLDEFYVRGARAGQGIGSQTLTFIEQQCRAMGATTLRLETSVENEGAIRLYERHGLVREPRYLMTKRLR